MTSYTARTTLSLATWDAGPEFDVDMVVTFTVTEARAATQIDPAEPAMVEDITIRLFKDKGAAELPIPDWQHSLFADDDGFKDWLMSEAEAQDEAAADDAAEARAEQAWEDRQRSLMESGGPDDSAYRRDMINAGRGHLVGR